MDLNERLLYEAKRTINIADRWYSEVISECINLQSLKGEMSEEEYEDSAKKVGTKLALICEYYLKGVLLPHLDITVPESDSDLQLIASQLTDDEKYKLIINDDDITKDIFKNYKNINKMSENRIKKLQGVSVKIFSHNLSKMIGTLTMGEDLVSKISPQIRKNIYREMRHYFYPLYNKKGAYTDEELMRRIAQSKNEFFTYDNSETFIDEETNPTILERVKNYEKELSEKKVKEAFPKSRYGHLDGYVPNNEFLLFLADAIRKSLRLEYENMVTISDSNDYPGLIEGVFTDGLDLSDFNGRKMKNIFPDVNSKIYVFDGNSGEVTRIYSLDKYTDDNLIGDAGKEEFLPILVKGKDFLYELHTKGMNEEEKNEHDSVSYYIYDVPQTFININEGRDTSISTSVVYYENGVPKSIEYKNGMLFSQNDEITKKLASIANVYEQEHQIENQEEQHRPTNIEFESSVPEEMLVSAFNSTILNELASEQEINIEIEEEK